MASRPILLSKPHQTGRELEFIAQALSSGYMAPAGPMLERFERAFAEYVGIPHGVAVVSGTAAIHLALRCLDVGPGEEVWASSLTFIGSIAPAVYQGAEPVFFDCDQASWTLDTDLLAEELAGAAKRRRLPRVVVPTDLYGQSCDLDTIVRLCDGYGVAVVADSAEAVGTLYKGRAAGDGARAAAYSFNGNKIITTSGGGLLASHDKALIDAARKLSTQAREPATHYEHVELGYNYRMSNICAAIGCAQLEVVEARVARRRAIYQRYRNALDGVPGLSFMPERDHGGSRATRWLTVMQIDAEAFGSGPDELRRVLEAAQIEARPVWKPMHLQPVFASARVVGGAVAEGLFRAGLCLPSGSELSDDDVDRVAEVILSQKR